MKKFILFILLIISNPSNSQSIVILTPSAYHPIIPYYVNKLPNTFNNTRGFVISDNTDLDIIKDKILAINPYLILFVGDLVINKFLFKYYDIFKNKSLVYCCNFRLDNNIEISGVDYQFEYSKLSSTVNQFSHVYIIKTNSDYSNLLTALILENIQNISIDVVPILSVRELRKFFINIPKNSIVINFLDNLDLNNDVSAEIELWNKKTIILDLNDNGIISIVPDYEEISDLLIDYTLLEKYFKFQHVLNLNLDYNKLKYINMQHVYFKFNDNIFKTVIIK